MFLVVGWLLVPLPMIAEALDVSPRRGARVRVAAVVVWAYVIERGIERLS